MRRIIAQCDRNAFIECSPEGGGPALYIFAAISVREFRIICLVVVVRDLVPVISDESFAEDFGARWSLKYLKLTALCVELLLILH